MKYSLSRSAFCRTIQLGELEALHIQHPRFSADILLQGAQIIRFAPVGTDNWLWLSEDASYRKNASVRGGIPICWPWFGQLACNPQHIRSQITTGPAHGFARSQEWTLTQLSESAHGINLVLTLENTEQTHALWPFRFRLEAHFSLGKRLELQLKTVNLDNQTFSISQALHSYFPTQDIRLTQIEGFNHTGYIDTLDHWQEKQQNGSIRFTGETDRIYLTGGCQRIRTPDSVCEIQTLGSNSTVVWNPWIRKSRQLTDFAADAWTRMLCIETANALHDSLTLAPGEEHIMGLSLSRNHAPD